MSLTKFTLQDNDGKFSFGTNKVSNWEELEPAIVRSESQYGLTRELTNVFEFIGDVRTRIISGIDLYGVNHYLQLTIEVGNDNADLLSFKKLNRGAPLVALFDEVPITELGVKVTFVDSDFQQKIDARKTQKLNITLDTNLDDGSVTDYTALLKDTYCHDRTLELNSEVNIDGDQLPSVNNQEWRTDIILGGLPSSAVYKSQDEVTNVFFFNAISTDTTSLLPQSFILYAEQDYIYSILIRFDFDITGRAIFDSSVQSDSIISVYPVLQRIKVDETRDTIRSWESESAKIFNYDDGYKTENINSGGVYSFPDLELLEGESLILTLVFKQLSLSIFWGFDTTAFEDKSDTYLIRINTTSFYPATVCKSILPHEFFTHWIELMTGVKNAFYSDFFGRTDIGYSEDGEGAYVTFLDGYMLRNMPIVEYPMNSSFEDRLQDMINMFGLAAQVQYIGTQEVYRIEKREDLLNSQTIVDLGEMTMGLSRDPVDQSTTYNSVTVGYADKEIEDLNGLGIYNGELNYSIPNNVDDNPLDLMSKGIAGDYIIEQTRRLQYADAPNEDGKNDKDIYYIECQKGSTYDITALKGSDYTAVSGILNPSEAYNLGITPSKILRNNGDLIKGCLKSDVTIKLIKSASNNTLIVNGISEGDDIDSVTLKNAIFINERYNIEESPASFEDWLIIENNPNGIVKFTNKGMNFYSYFNRGGYNINSEKLNCELIKSNR